MPSRDQTFDIELSAQPEVGVPRQLMLTELMLLTAMFACLFGLLTLLGADGGRTIIISSFVVLVSLGQAILFDGHRPHKASVVVGGVVAPLLLTAAWLDEMWLRLLGTQLHVAGVNTFARFCTWFAMLAIVGPILGYLAGLFVAGWFFVCDAFRERLLGHNPRPITQPIRTASDSNDRDSQSPKWLATVEAVVEWLVKPSVSKTQIEKTMIVFVTASVLALMVAPYFPSSWRLRLFVFPCLCAFLSAGMRLGILWFLAVVALGGIATLPMLSELHQIVYVRETVGDSPLLGLLIGMTGMFCAALIGSLVGWLQTVANGLRESVESGSRPRWVARVAALGGVLLLSLIAFGTVRSYRHSPRERLASQITENGGGFWWAGGVPNSIRWRPRPEGAQITQNAAAHLEAYVNAYGLAGQVVYITDPVFCDEHLHTLDRQKLRALTIDGSSLSDEAFKQVEDFGANYLRLSKSDVGNATIERLTNFKALQVSLIDLNVAETQVTTLAGIEKFQRLTSIDCSGCNIKCDATVPVVWTVTVATFSDCPLSDDDVLSLVNAFPNTTTLRLERTQITNESAAHLAKLKRLQVLSVSGTKLTPQDIRQLEQRLPNVRVEFETD